MSGVVFDPESQLHGMDASDDVDILGVVDVKVIGVPGPASIALGSLVNGPINSVLRMTADGPVWQPNGDAPFVKRLNPITQQMVSPPTVTQGAEGAATAISGGVQVDFDNAALTYYGVQVGVGPFYPDAIAYSPANIQADDGSKDIYALGPWGVEFEYDGQELELYIKGTNARYRCTVDGEGYDVRAGHAGPPADGGFYRILYDFGSATARRLRFDFASSIKLFGVIRESTAAITATTKAFGPKVLVLGDSFTEASPDAEFASFGDRLGQYCGWRNVTMSGWGGTGYLATNGGSRTTFRTRTTKDVIAAAPDIVIVAGGINDQSSYVEATFETEADLLFDAIMTGLPDCTLIVVGPWWPNGAPVANAVKVRDSIREKAQPYARLFIDNIGGTIPYTGTVGDYGDQGWMTGTGRVGSLQHDGNSDYYTSSDGTHPTQAGHDYLALRLAEAIALDAPEVLG